ncbi:MAG: PIN domain-containing protein [Actinomycetota bacterium]
MADSLLLLDTTVLIDVLRGRAVTDRLRAHRDDGELACTTAVNVEEIARGLRRRELSGATALFVGLVVLPLSRHEGWQAGVWRKDYVARGVTLSQADCLIAAAALTADARLVTGNPRHFPMREIAVEHWPSGE